MPESPRNHHLHGPERPTSSETTPPPKDIGALACGASYPHYREGSSVPDSTTLSSNRDREIPQGASIDDDTTDEAAVDEDYYAGLPTIPQDLFASEKMPQMRSSHEIKGEVHPCVKIPAEIASDLRRVNSRGDIDADSLQTQIDACDKLIRYLDLYWNSLSLSNIRFMSDELAAKYAQGTLDDSDLKRARRAITGLQIETSREIDRLKNLRHEVIWGNSYSYYVDSSTA